MTIQTLYQAGQIALHTSPKETESATVCDLLPNCHAAASSTSGYLCDHDHALLNIHAIITGKYP